jgi:hypothetical protein
LVIVENGQPRAVIVANTNEALAVKATAEPDKWVSTMAYSNREMPPQGVKLLPNMSVKYAPISCCVLHPNNDPGCGRRQEMMAILQ